MQIRRSPHLTFLLSAVLSCSMAVAMVVAALVPASASSYGLEQHPAGDFVKRMDPEGVQTLEYLLTQDQRKVEEATQLEKDVKNGLIWGRPPQGGAEAITRGKDEAAARIAHVQNALKEEWGKDLKIADAEAAAVRQQWGAGIGLGRH